MEFIPTKHAKKRFYERGLPNPTKQELKLKRASKTVRRFVIEKFGWGKDLCDLTFFLCEYEKRKIVYLCKEVRDQVFLIITAFKLR